MEQAKYQAALESYEAAAALEVAVSESAFGMAKAHAALGHDEQATKNLKAAIALGFEDKQRLELFLQRAKLDGAAVVELKLLAEKEMQAAETQAQASADKKLRYIIQSENDSQAQEYLELARVKSQMAESQIAEQALRAYKEALAVGAEDEYIRTIEHLLREDGELAESYRIAIESAAGAERAGLLLGADKDLRIAHVFEQDGEKTRWLLAGKPAPAGVKLELLEEFSKGDPFAQEAESFRWLVTDDEASGGTWVGRAKDAPTRVRLVQEVQDTLAPHAAPKLPANHGQHETHELPELRVARELIGARDDARSIRLAPKSAEVDADLAGIAADLAAREAAKDAAREVTSRSAEAKAKATDLKVHLEQRRNEMRKLEVELEIRRVELENLERKLELESLEQELKKLKEDAKAQTPKPTKKAS